MLQLKLLPLSILVCLPVPDKLLEHYIALILIYNKLYWKNINPGSLFKSQSGVTSESLGRLSFVWLETGFHHESLIIKWVSLFTVGSKEFLLVKQKLHYLLLFVWMWTLPSLKCCDFFKATRLLIFALCM